MPGLTFWRTASTGKKIVNHLRGDGVDVRKWPGDITGHGCGYGIIGKVRDAWQGTLDAGFSWCYADGPYFLRRKPDSVRMAWGGQWFVSGPERRVKSLEERGVYLQDHEPGSVVFVCPSHPLQHEVQYKLPVDRWIERTTAELRKHTDRPIEVRWKGDPSRSIDVRVADMQRVFDRAWAVVTAGSTIGCEAIAAGVPVFSDKPCAASPLGLSDLSMIETPIDPMQCDRERWAHNLVARQFDTVELRKGKAWTVLREDLEFAESR